MLFLWMEVTHRPPKFCGTYIHFSILMIDKESAPNILISIVQTLSGASLQIWKDLSVFLVVDCWNGVFLAATGKGNKLETIRLLGV